MAKILDIEYCGAWGYGPSATQLKKALAAVFPEVEINCHSAGSSTSKIEVAWISEGQKKMVWSDSKKATNDNHAKIIELVKGSAWNNHKETNKELTNRQWRFPLKVPEDFWSNDSVNSIIVLNTHF
jgi:selT/selW/selH-like putative selenoprotein